VAGFRENVAGFEKNVASFGKNVAVFGNKNLQKSNTNLFLISLFTSHFSLLSGAPGVSKFLPSRVRVERGRLIF
jgi:hypothetical protein